MMSIFICEREEASCLHLQAVIDSSTLAQRHMDPRVVIRGRTAGQAAHVPSGPRVPEASVSSLDSESLKGHGVHRLLRLSQVLCRSNNSAARTGKGGTIATEQQEGGMAETTIKSGTLFFGIFPEKG